MCSGEGHTFILGCEKQDAFKTQSEENRASAHGCRAGRGCLKMWEREREGEGGTGERPAPRPGRLGT